MKMYSTFYRVYDADGQLIRETKNAIEAAKAMPVDGMVWQVDRVRMIISEKEKRTYERERRKIPR